AAEAGVRFRTVRTRLTVPEAGQLQVQPPAREGESWIGVTEPGEVKRAPVAFCLGQAGAALYAGPDAGSVQLAQLPSGAFITVLETAGDFLRVITSDDSFGYIPRTTEMSEVDLKGGHGRR
ncbi:MAG TPA: SH3 domain-containing protein, partial [Dehalococcoidia bacterium]|nr:SH3 domain-containing protein [Dehalococcoidia bacterium]